jgi:CzcA family heavy metal efflux pump
MLEKIIKFSLNNQLLVLLGAVLLIVVGTLAIQNMEIDVFPDLTAPTVVVMTDAEGMSAEEVERMVTFHIETAVNGATDVRRVRSVSSQGFSFIWVEFDWGTDIFRARQIVSERMVTLSDALPTGIVPVLAPQSSVMGEILFIGMTAETTSLMELRTLADWLVKPAILATGGVSQVTVVGGDYKQYQILADPQKMDIYGVSLLELADVGRSISLNTVGGTLRDFGNEYDLRGIARTNDLEELGLTFVKTVNGKPVVISDVADVVIGSAVKMGFASQNGNPAVIISVSKQPSINTLKVTRKIEENLRDLQQSLPPDIKIDKNIFRQADFIEASVANVASATVQGAILVIIILFIFLMSFRTTIISVVVIPLSLLATIIVLRMLGMNINTMTLGGICIAVGTLVDEAIISVENIFKRLRQNHHLPTEQQKSIYNVIFDATLEIRASIMNATFIIITAFTPLFFLSGMEGLMLKPLGVAFIVASFMSTFIAMTVTPIMCKLLLTNEKYLESNKRDSKVSQKLIEIYSISLDWVLHNRKKVIYTTLAILTITIILYARMGQSFLPEFNEGSLTINAVAKPGVSLYENDRLGNLMERELLTIPEITSVSRRTGRGELDEHSQASNSSELDVNFQLGSRKRDAFLADVRHTLSGIPGVATSVGQPLSHRIDVMLSGTSASIAIKIFGPNLSNLFMMGNQIQNTIQNIEGLVDVSVEQQTETPQLQIRANRGMMAHYGISMEEFDEFIKHAFAGEKLAEIYEGQRSFDLILRLNDNYTQSIEGVRSALISTESGRKVPLEQIAAIVSTGGPNSISRENVQRNIVVSANVAGRDLRSVVNDIQRTINQNVKLPEGYRIEYGGQFESAANATRTLFIVSLLAICVIFILLYTEFKNITLSAIIMLNLPLAIIGGVFALFLTSNIVSIPAIIGFISLFGIATRNGILLISRYQNLEQSGENLRETVMQGSTDRLNPILMTAISTAWALLPLALQGSRTGNEIQSPMAIVILGGLLSSTLLNIYIVPIAYEIVRNWKVAKR